MFNVNDLPKGDIILNKEEEISINEKTEALFGEIISKTNVWVIGCGAVGSGVIERLSQLNPYINKLTVIDYDTVEAHNVGCQCFGIQEIGMSKVTAMRTRMLRDRAFNIHCINDRLSNENITQYLNISPGDVVIVGVDNIDISKLIFSYLIGKEYLMVMYPGIPLHIDSFMAASGTLRLMFDDNDLRDILKAYEDTTHEQLMLRVTDTLERGCRTQQYSPLVHSVCAATAQVFGTVMYALNQDDASFVLDSVSRVYTIGGVLPYIAQVSKYS